MSSSNNKVPLMARNRIQHELRKLDKNLPDEITAKPNDKNILQIHYVIKGPTNTPYEGGYYHGVLDLPSEYPMKPPAIRMYTPSGRFVPGKRICLSMSDYHAETWNPAWSIATILTGLLSFMTENTHSVGTVESSYAEKRKLAMKSLEFNVADGRFRRLFPELTQGYEAAQNSTDSDIADTSGEEKEVAQANSNKPQSSTNSSSEWKPVLFKLAIIAVAVYVAYIQRT